MKKFSSLVGLGVLLALAGSAAAEGGENKKVTINFTFDTNGNVALGTYVLSGALNESGPVEAVTGSFVDDEGVPHLYSVKFLRLAGGDILLYQEGAITPTSSGFTVSGTWRLLGGTGAYLGIRGRGTEEIIGAPTASGAHVTGVYKGRINLPGRDDE